MSDLALDLRTGLRALARNPILTGAALLSLALGIGANSIIFSVVHAVLLSPLPYPDPDRIVMLWERPRETADAPVAKGVPAGLMPLSVPNFYDYRERAKVFSHLSNFNVGDATVLPGKLEAERVWAAGVFHGFFEVFGVNPIAGRTFLPEEDVPGRNKVVVLADSLWERWFQRDPAAIGKTILYEGDEVTVIGIMPPGFEFPRNAKIWHPAAFPKDFAPRNFNFVYTVGRLQPDVPVAQAKSEVAAIASALSEEFPQDNKERDAFLIGLHDYTVRDVRPALWLLTTAVGLVLLIACGNVASLLLARAVSRRGEVAVRVALGASRSRIVRQLLTESVVLALTAGVLGIWLAFFGLKSLLPLLEGQVPRSAEIGLDATVVLFTLALSFVSGLLFGLAPALRLSRPDVAQTLKDEGNERVARGQILQRTLVVAQVALAVTLFVGAGLLLRSFTRLLAVDPGFSPERLLTFEITLPFAQYQDRGRVISFFEELQQRLGALPDVESVGATWFLPMTGRNAGTGLTIQGDPLKPDKPYISNLQAVTPNFFETVRMRLVEGRSFSGADGSGAPGVVIVNEEAARRFWPGRTPVGERISFSAAFGREGQANAVGWEVVGVVGDVRALGLDREVQPEIYFLNAQSTWRWHSFVVRTAAADPLQVVSSVRRVVAELDPNLPIGQIRSLDDILDRTVVRPRLYASLMAMFSAIALVLAGVGVYGVVAYGVGMKRQEIAVRMALGASRERVVRMVVLDGVRLGVLGLILGLLGAVATTRLLRNLLFGVEPGDPATFAAVAVALLVVVLIASWLPARAATRIAPRAALGAG